MTPILGSFWTMGGFLYLASSWYFRDWKISALVCFLPIFINCFLGPFFIPESPRWLYKKGRVAESIDLLHKIAETNNRTLHSRTEKLLEQDWNAEESKPDVISLLLKHKTLALRFCILLLIQ